MKKIRTVELLENLKTDTRQIVLQSNRLLHEDPEVLVQTPGETRWSVTQVIEHLNSYGRYYLPLIQEALNNRKFLPNEFYKPGWLGDYFTNSMLPKKDGQIKNKMQAPKGHRPTHDLDNDTVLKEFIEQEHLLLELLEQATSTNLERVRVPISISRFIKLQLGDTIRFLIAHHQRHFVQVQKTLQELKDLKWQSYDFMEFK